MSEAQIQQEWQVFCRKLHPTRGRVLWRSFAAQQHIAALKLLDFHPDQARGLAPTLTLTPNPNPNPKP